MRDPAATVLRYATEVDAAGPGLYVVRAGDPAYFPAMALIEAGIARLLGETYSYSNARIVTLEIAPQRGLAGTAPTQHSITIGGEFFLTALKDYEDWQLKWWREVVQNSIDAGARHIALGDQKLPDDTVLVYADDDGSGMDEDTVVNKFLVLGATTKVAGSGAAGGFGKAKELLLLPWLAWRIHTRDTLIEGAGINYTVQRAPYRVGTRLEVIMPPDKATGHVQALAFLEKSYLPHVMFTVNDKPVQANLEGRQLITSVPGKADIYFTPTVGKQPYLYVRARGLYMFPRYIGNIPGYVLAELTAPSIEILTANRDGFRDRSVAREIDVLAERIAKDNMTALKHKQGLIRQRFEGSGKFRARRLAASLLNQIGPTSVGRLSADDNAQVLAALSDYVRADEHESQATQLPSPPVAQVMLDQKFTGPSHIEAAIKQLVWEPDFYLMNDIEGWKVPRKFFPATMTPFVLKLAKTWVELCRYVLMQLGSSTKFGVGFIFSRDMAAAALNEDDSEGVAAWLMLNPFKNMTSGDIWHPAQHADLQWLYAAAIHEATHVADGIQYHDESFAAALTRNMARCADGYRKIRAIVSGIRMYGGIQADVDT